MITITVWSAVSGARIGPDSPARRTILVEVVMLSFAELTSLECIASSGAVLAIAVVTVVVGRPVAKVVDAALQCISGPVSVQGMGVVSR